jgi:hypothetical protein
MLWVIIVLAKQVDRIRGPIFRRASSRDLTRTRRNPRLRGSGGLTRTKSRRRRRDTASTKRIHQEKLLCD